MANVTYAALQVGDEIPAFQSEPISRHTLALYCGASGDHNPIHVDVDFAKAAGYDDVFAHGMLSMAYMGRLLTNWVPHSAIRKLGVRFSAITHVHDVVTCTGKVIEKTQQDGENCVRLAVSATTQDGAQTLKGEAVVALP